MADSVARTLGNIIEGGAGTADSMVRTLVDVGEGEEGMADSMGVGEGNVVGFGGDELRGPFLLGGGRFAKRVRIILQNFSSGRMSVLNPRLSDINSWVTVTASG